jgi:mycothiol synthase
MTMLEIENLKTALPDGYTARPVTMEDVEAFTALFNLYEKYTEGVEPFTVAEIRGQWEAPIFHLSEDSMAVWNAEGRPAGYVEFLDMNPAHVQIHVWACVHPNDEERGIGSFLRDWAIQRGQRNLDRAPQGKRVVLHQYINHEHMEAKALLEAGGYRHIRSSYRMRIDFDTPPEAPVLPQGITIRSIQRGEERLAIEAAHESFKDHWGVVEEPFESYYQRWIYRIEHDPNYDPSLWWIAMDGEKVTGVSLCYSKIDFDPEMGWVGTLGVLRPWRKQGIGMALLRHSFCEFYRMGKPRGGLGVDASSLTGALRLYENAGMHPYYQSDLYEYEVRPGQDMMRQHLDEE